MRWLVIDHNESKAQVFSEKQKALDYAESILEEYRELAAEHGWPDVDTGFIQVAEVFAHAKKIEAGQIRWDGEDVDAINFGLVATKQAHKLKDWQLEKIDENTIKVYKKDDAGVVVREHKAQHNDRKSIAEHALFLLAKDLVA